VPRASVPRTFKPRSRPVNPAGWLERTEQLVDQYWSARGKAGPDPALGFIWIAADHIFENNGLAADFALLDVPLLMEDCAWLVTGKSAQFVAALTAFYTFLGEAQLVEPSRAAAIRQELAASLSPPA
jgi:hypothetical protein